ncbi:hypothetical protein Cni_G10421 [Canna indica]|uniref:Polymerase nucleotidyl transferase domain-containing protein n=1 Tax=Canna indica TaxID=4628 RepID=A0AAQ3K419_9LILI|nr:hypothetical protein Cni_G10421 [Canna indica]
MGDHSVWAQTIGLLPNGLLPKEKGKATQVLDADRWLKAEEQTAELITQIQPNPSSEDRRNAVANYVKRLITNCLSCRVCTFGSVPLKTYLPDGDIDLTAFSDNENLKDTWATAVCGVLENEEKSENAEFRVKEVKYIQAEVKLIKCLVENIVVDISFNQVGGLCTLCFLGEMDKVINRNHLFKRSIILIKAWCYYESRILGAHHGLISTYALETLVLYIFHVFNNSFAGPLEVLYRFLEFFSNFDWDNYCVSLWGPVPINLLPEMTAEPPRKDNGKLLFSKTFLDSCTAIYSVTPGGQENQIQPFVSKHFNVVDPLRTNNNLGRSVSKGNFFRIRSAFTYGAKRLARLLECPKDAITAEINRFFMNTWKRNETSDRPDILGLGSRLWQPVETVPVEESNNPNSNTGFRKKLENGVLNVGEEHVAETGQSSHSSISEIHDNHQNVYRLNNPSAVSHVQSQISYRKQINSRFNDQLERSHSSSGSVPSDKNQKLLKPNYSVNDQEEQGRFQFARTRSSPELTETSFNLSQGRQDRVTETAKAQSAAKFDSGIKRKNFGSEYTDSHSSKSSVDDYTSTKQALSQRNFEVPSEANSVSNSHQGDFGFTNMREELASVSETLEMQQEQQDLVNMMGSSNIHSFNGQVPFPMHLAHFHVPLTFSPVSAPMGYVKRNLAGVIPSNLSLIAPPWGSNMQFTQSLASFPLSHYIRAASYNSNVDVAIESSNDGSVAADLNPEDNDQGNWHEDDSVLSRRSNPVSNGPLDGKQQKLEGNINSSPTARGSNSSSLSRGYNKLGREDKTSTREDINTSVQSKTSRTGDIYSGLRSSNAKFFPPTQASSSRSKSTTENIRDRSTANTSGRDRWGRKPVSPSVSTSTFGRENRLQFEASSDNISLEVDDDISGWIPLSTMGNEMPDRTTESASSASPHDRSQHLPGFESLQNQSDQLIPIPPLLGASQQRALDYSKYFPTFVATGPPVPYLVYPFGNLTSNNGNPDGSSRQFDREEPDQIQVSSSDQNINSVDSLDQSEVVVSPSFSRNSALESSEETTSDILNSDLNGHWKNLEFGRFCQNPYYHGSFMYSPPALGSPIYLSSHYPWDAHGRSIASNLNCTQIMGHSPRLVPVMPLQPGPDRASSVFQHNVDEAPRYRGGTGTYLPNPKASFRDRQSSSRNHRGNRNYDRSDLGDRPRPFDRSHGCNQAERAGFRSDRMSAAKYQEKRWESSKHEPHASYRGVDRTFAPTNSSHNLENAFGLYSQTAFSSNGGIPPDPPIPPVVLVYPYDQGVADGSSAEPLEFGSLRAVHLPSGNGARRVSDGIAEVDLSDQRHSSYSRGGSSRSSPDQPSSPHL